MIVRQDGGHLILVGQTDHSRLVGQFASHWGNKTFARPKPFDTVARAATFHDYGWLRYETEPKLGDAGETPGFRQIPADASQLESFQWCIDWLGNIDPYAGTIVSMHRTGLWRQRYGVIANPPPTPPRPLPPPIEDFIARNEKRQEAGRSTRDADEVWTNYHLMQVWDLLGLYFCCQDPYDDHIDPVPTVYSGDRTAGVKMTLTPKDKTSVVFDPFPFGEGPCQVQLSWKRLPQIKWPDLESFRAAYFSAKNELVTFNLLPA